MAEKDKCKCGSLLREGESECDRCILEKYGLNKEPLWRITAIAKALRRAYEQGFCDRTAGAVDSFDDMGFDCKRAQKRHERLLKLRKEKTGESTEEE